MTVFGCVERVNRERIVGWVTEEAHPVRRHVVEVYVRDRQVAAAPATVERQEVARRLGGKRTDIGFEILLPYGTMLDTDQMSVRVVGCDVALPIANGATRPEGVLDFLAGTAIGGWAWHTGRPSERVTVNVKHKGRQVASVVADGFRQDLFEAGVGDGAHGFMIDLAVEAGIAQLAADEVEVAFGSSGDPLFNLIKNRSALSQFGNRIAG
jgi:hypothetical protein